MEICTDALCFNRFFEEQNTDRQNVSLHDPANGSDAIVEKFVSQPLPRPQHYRQGLGWLQQ